MNMTSTMTVIDNDNNSNNSDNNNETMTPFVHPGPNEKNESSTATNQTPFVDELEEEESFMTATPSTSEDWSEDYPSDEDDDNHNGNDKKVNGTGLILYVTPTHTKAAYWKRRLGWKPSMSKLTTTKKIKKLFRAPVRTHIRKGSYDLKGADALAIKPKANKSFAGSETDRKRVVSDEGPVLEYGTKDFDKLGAVDHELVFA